MTAHLLLEIVDFNVGGAELLLKLIPLFADLLQERVVLRGRAPVALNLLLELLLDSGEGLVLVAKLLLFGPRL